MNKHSWYRALMMLGLVIGVVWPQVASSYENEPAGFGGMDWGDSVPDDLIFMREDPVTFDLIFTRSSDSMRFGSASADSVYYVFNFAGQFYKAEIYASGYEDDTEFYAYLKERHGEADESTGDEARNRSMWKGQTTTIFLTHDETEYPSETYISYVGVGVVESTNEMLDSALEFLEGPEKEPDEKEESFERLFD